MNVRILGAHDAQSNMLNTATKQALTILGFAPDVPLVTDPSAIAAAGSPALPALVIDDTVLSQGKQLKVKPVKKLIADYLATR